MRHFAAEAVETVANVDNRLLRTLRLLLTRPGLLTAEYFAGRRVLLLRPLQLFLLCNVVFFFVQGWSGSRVLNTPLEVHVHATGHRLLAHRLAYGAPHVDGELLGPAHERFRRRFDAAVDTQSRGLVIAMVPMLAAVLAVVFLRRRRYLLEHLIFAVHFYAFMLLVTPLLVWAVITGARAAAAAGWGMADFTDASLAVPILAVWSAYLALAVRRFYGDRLPGAALRGVVLAFAAMQVLVLYRVLLFFTAYLAARAG